MNLNKRNLLISILIFVVLAFIFWYGGDAPGLRGWKISNSNKNIEEVDNSELLDETNELEEDIKTDTKEKINKNDCNKEQLKSKSLEQLENESLSENKVNNQVDKTLKKDNKEHHKLESMEIDEKTGKDKYLTDPVPEGKPEPVEPENIEVTNDKGYCTLSVRADTILDNIEWLNPEKVELVPEDGVIYETKTVEFYKGESVFNVLLREMKQSKIHMEFVNTPMYNSAYIQGINNLYEFDCGELSGWMYKVNDWFPNYGASRYLLEDGDVIEWLYTCNLGEDIGGENALGGD